jgi:hypothetical protein
MEKTRITIAAMLIIAMASVAHAQAAQSFPHNSIDSNQLTRADVDSVQSEFSDPGMLPDNPFYFVKIISEKLRLMFTLNDNDRTQLHLDNARTRLAEARSLMAENKTGAANASIKNFAAEIRAIPIGAGDNEKSGIMIKKSLIVLNTAYDSAPVQIKGAIDDAIESSVAKSASMGSPAKNIAERITTARENSDMIRERIRVIHGGEMEHADRPVANQTNATDGNATAASHSGERGDGYGMAQVTEIHRVGWINQTSGSNQIATTSESHEGGVGSSTATATTSSTTSGSTETDDHSSSGSQDSGKEEHD